MKHILVKKARDNVGNALEAISAGDIFICEIEGRCRELTARTDVPFAFKVSVENIKKGEPIFCYGEPIGLASADITAGECVHVHNLQGRRANK